MHCAIRSASRCWFSYIYSHSFLTLRVPHFDHALWGNNVSNEEIHMGINKDQVEGRAKEVAGKAQNVIGKVVHSTAQEVKGKVHEEAGKAEAIAGDLKEKMKKATK
jgi:uncharacterized protein YjbJ (UPF0337 family)